MITSLFWGAILPAVIAGVLALLAGILPGLVGRPIRRLSFPIAFAVGYYFINSIPSWPPSGLVNSLYYVGFLCFFWSFIEAMGGRFAKLMRVFLFAIVIFVLLKPMLMNENLPGDLPGVTGKLELFCHIVVWIFIGQGLWWLFAKGMTSSTLQLLALIPLLSMTGMSLLFMFSSSAMLAQIVGVYCAVHAAGLILSLISPRFFKFEDHMIFTVALLFGFTLLAVYYIEVSLISVALVLLPLLLLVFWKWIPFKPKSTFGQIVVASAVALIPIAIGVWPIYNRYISTQGGF